MALKDWVQIINLKDYAVWRSKTNFLKSIGVFKNSFSINNNGKIRHYRQKSFKDGISRAIKYMEKN